MDSEYLSAEFFGLFQWAIHTFLDDCTEIVHFYFGLDNLSLLKMCSSDQKLYFSEKLTLRAFISCSFWIFFDFLRELICQQLFALDSIICPYSCFYLFFNYFPITTKWRQKKTKMIIEEVCVLIFFCFLF